MDKILDDLDLSLNLNDPRKKTLDVFRQVLKKIPTEAGQKYALHQFLNNKDFGFSNPKEFGDVNESVWSDYDEDFVPPDVEKYEQTRDAEDFWNWDSEKHWTKRDTKELERKAKKAGYVDTQSYLDAVGEVQKTKDREKLLSDEFGIATPLVKLAYPRSTEALLRGDDIKGTDVGLDFVEQALYALDPVGRAAAGAKFASKGAGKFAAELLGAAANPTIMELSDNIAYSNNPDSERSKFNIGDVGIGTGINFTMGRLVPIVTKKKVKTTHENKLKEAPTEGSIEELNKWSTKIDKETNKLNDLQEMKSEAIRRQDKKQVAYADYLIKEQEKKLADVWEYDEPLMLIKSPTMKEKAKYEANNLIPDALSLVSNKAGDAISEDPRMTKRVLRTATGPVNRFVGPFMNDWIDSYYEAQDKKAEKRKIEELLGGIE